MQSQLPLALLTLVTLITAAPVAPIERCTAADTGKLCKAGAINGFFVNGFCTDLPIRQDASQFACIPGGTLSGTEAS
ncbi:hypothetical protein GLAREA_07517 [Glarea lozoyensis ATCC 20868]|uniref:Uncharacterized protein n=1 Tax=Glarea lozoyensis (strain ATCC 20868 / MF5171) TaxID=1116229 RepID=S3D5J8_GLAL2|nr:uncharacterized protein GLAREA_07517 [Glarea lozoyensis ATCC 20868]EPE32384.1 hypothetical protein GLAREA_07517 [Glarea lozoyensis ATCC 20868]